MADRIFYSDYGMDDLRAQKVERLLAPAQDSGIEICRTSLEPIPTRFKNLAMPAFMRKARLQLFPKLNVSESERRFARYTGEALRISRGKLTSEEAEQLMSLYVTYIHEELADFSPDMVVLWAQFGAYHYVIERWAKQRKLPILYGENGVLPESWCFEFGGQMGESWIAGKPAQFKELAIGPADRDLAVAYLDRVVRERLNRKGAGTPVADTGLAALLADNKRPVILYAGINDEKTGVRPFSSQRTPLHSPGYASTAAGAEALLEVARANDWLILFKQHPSRIGRDKPMDNSDHLVMVEPDTDLVDLIGHCDAVATLVSQTAYMALFHGKPCVLMGRMQLTGSGLVHEALMPKDLDTAAKAALATGFPTAARDALIDHVARLLKYYVVYYDFDKSDYFHYNLNDVADSLKAVKV